MHPAPWLGGHTRVLAFHLLYSKQQGSSRAAVDLSQESAQLRQEGVDLEGGAPAVRGAALLSELRVAHALA